MDVFDSIRNAPRGIVQFPQPGERKIGGYAVVLTGVWRDSGQWLEFMNWWGGDWGNEGLGYVSLEYLNRYMIDAWFSRDAGVGLTALNYRRFMQAKDLRERARTWLLPNPRLQQRHRYAGLGHQLAVYETLSLVDERPVQIVEVRTGFGIRVGWAHLFHLVGPERTSVLKELFVWPSFRRHGYGSLLESIAATNARRWGAKHLQVLFHEMDAHVPQRAAGRLFGEKCGYQWRWRSSSRPGVTAIGEKPL